jgi:outer membrane lipoprotein-sorting protein
MKRRLLISCILVLGIAAAASAATISNDDSIRLRARIKDYAGKFASMKATVVVTKTNRRELDKMGAGIGMSYQFEKADVEFKSPDKMRLDGKLGMMKVQFVTTGSMRWVKTPVMKKQEEITNEPMKQMTALDVGVVSERFWDLYDVKCVGIQDLESCPVYVLRLQAKGSMKSQLLYIDTVGLKLMRSDRLLDDGKINVKTIYSGHKQIGGVWVPSKAMVYNGDDKLAAATETRDVAVNVPLEDKEFAL